MKEIQRKVLWDDPNPQEDGCIIEGFSERWGVLEDSEGRSIGELNTYHRDGEVHVRVVEGFDFVEIGGDHPHSCCRSMAWLDQEGLKNLIALLEEYVK